MVCSQPLGQWILKYALAGIDIKQLDYDRLLFSAMVLGVGLLDFDWNQMKQEPQHLRLLSTKIHLHLFFFFKQKTAYEMRISDWSSDVCSSDLFPSHDMGLFRTSSS